MLLTTILNHVQKFKSFVFIYGPSPGCKRFFPF